jgi:hypothetical protein
MNVARSCNHPILKIWLKFLLVVLPLTVVWALANPMFASPDEPAHMVRAQGIVGGDSKEPYVTDGIPGDQVICMAFKWDTTADCMNLAWGTDGEIQGSPTDTYPPLFHAVAGIPSLAFDGLKGAYIMRLWMAFVCSSMIALAATLLWFRRQHIWSIGGLIAAVTPMVVFTSATVNPSGITSALASLIWAGGLNITKPTETTNLRLSRWTFIASVILFPLLRRDALAWEIVVLAILATTISLKRLNELKRDRLMLGALVALMANMVFVWFTWSGTATDSFVSNSASHGGGSWASGLGSLYTKILEMTGWFGWLDSPMTSESSVLLLCLLFLVISLAMTGGQRDLARTVAITLVALLSAPVLIGTVRYPYVQGRYLLPLWIGCMLVAGQALAESELPKLFLQRIFKMFIGLMAIIQFFAFAQNLRRYAVGRTGSWKFFQHSNWHPPMMSNLVALLLMAVALSISLISVRSICRTESSPQYSVS